MKLTRIRWSRRATGIAAGTVATAVAAGATAVAIGIGTDWTGDWSSGEGSTESALHTVDFPPVDGASRPEAAISSRTTARFSLVGLTWTDPRAELNGTVKIRTRAVGSGRWSGWQDLDAHGHPGPERVSAEAAGRMRGSTDPLWVGPSNGVEVRVVAASGGVSDKLPAGLRLDLVDPGDSPRRKSGAAGAGQGRGPALEPVANVRQQAAAEPTPSDLAPAESPSAEPVPTDPTVDPTVTPTSDPVPTATATPGPTAPATPTPTGTVNPIPAPSLVTRAGWRANESITGSAEYGTTVKAVFVHHTAGSNSYSCADSPAIIRAIQTYHVKSNGWEDIGYNFLVDKCGTLFEGHKGGIDQPVIGAHTYGFNTNTTGIAVLGTYISSGVSNPVQNTIAHLAAWKLGKYGNDPAGKVTLVAGLDTGKYAKGQAVSMYRISGHRDGYPTECPGAALYGQLPTIRVKAGRVTGLAITGIAGANKAGTTYYTKGTVTVSWSVSMPTALLSRFDVLVDGTPVATASAGARSATVTIPSGRHTVQIRGVNRTGATGTSPGQIVVVDQTPPTFGRYPQVRLRNGTVNPTGAPVTLIWSATDAVALRSVGITAPHVATFAPTATSWATAVRPGRASTWTMRADDWAGNTLSASSTSTTTLVGETAARRSGTWRTSTNTAYLGGSALSSPNRGASLRWTFTGRSASFIASRSPGSGQVHIYVDGVKMTTIDLVSSTTRHRQAVWSIGWGSTGTHTIQIVVAGTSRRPTVITDGIAYVR